MTNASAVNFRAGQVAGEQVAEGAESDCPCPTIDYLRSLEYAPRIAALGFHSVVSQKADDRGPAMTWRCLDT